jgi:aspartyl-tRNA(Asn)/glutamyl-tRNA(Gln) amidotransferase subunit C
MNVDEALVLKLEKLARLKLTDTEKEKLKNDLDKIINMFSMVAEVNTENVAPLIHMSNETNVLREDVIGNHLDISKMNDVAPLIKHNMFAVPKVIEQ